MSDDTPALPSAADVLKQQVPHTWLYSRQVLEGLDEDEYFWEPAPLCWSVRRRALEVRGWGRGEFVCEDAWPAPDPLPLTTIAWRVVHLAAWTDVYRCWAFTDERPTILDADLPGDAAGGLRWLYDVQDAFISAIDALDDTAVFESRPVHWGESIPVAQMVTSMLAENVHHIAEVGVLRDLHRGHAVSRPLPTLAPKPGPPWWEGG